MLNGCVDSTILTKPNAFVTMNKRDFNKLDPWQLKSQEDATNISWPMRASRWPLFVSLEEFPTGLFHFRQISKIKEYYAIEKGMLDEGDGSTKKNTQRNRIRLRWKQFQKKRCRWRSMTINERERISHTPLYGISLIFQGFDQTSKSTCKVRAKFAWCYGPCSSRGTLLYKNCPHGNPS